MQANNLLVTGKSRFLNEINGNISGTSSNVTGTVALNHGGTGATTRLAAAKVLTDEPVVTPGFVVGLTNNWGQFGYTSMANLKTTLGLGTAAYTASTAYLGSSTKYAASSSVGGAATSAEKLTNTSKVGDTNKPVYFTANGVPSAISYTIGKSVPSTAVFTDENVDQVVDTTSASDFRLLFSGTANDTETVTYTKKSSYLIYNPSDNKITLKSNSSGKLSIVLNNTAGSRSLTIGSDDITLAGQPTWDGTHQSLKSAIGAKANAASPTITGNMTMSNGSISMSHNASIIGLSAIELYCPTTSGNHGGFIDFHWNQDTADYTARLIETSSKGTIKAYNSISNASDRRLKDNIVDIDDKYVGLLNIVNAKQYNFKSSEDKTDLGFIAQEVEDAMKQIGIADDKMPIISKPTDNDVDKYYGLDYSQMTALLWKICQVQQKEIDELKNK